MERIDLYIESLIFASERPVTFEDIKKSVESYFSDVISDDLLYQTIDNLKDKYLSEDFSFRVVEISNGYSFATKTDFHDMIGAYLKIINRSKLSKASLETLAIIAYNQPATKPQVEQIRGVNSDYSIQKLLDKNLIEISGREEGPGKPLIFITSQKFLDYFGIKSLKDLPDLKEFNPNNNFAGKIEEE
ncbi:MAG: SMC-Scp complex subunit ScpB [Deltaproteobacteria bacterium]